ncbi:MAG: sugar ABC transporter permease [Chloroflexota bacterium]|nr:MAG: ABC transporter permease [Chloroflexota bacterium]
MRVSNRFIILLLLPATALYFLFFLVPTLQALVYSLYDWSGFGAAPVFIGLRNFRELLNDRVFWTSMGNTIGILVIGGVVIFGLAFVMTMMISSGIRGKKFFRSIIFLPNIIAVIALTTLWGYMYTPRTGLFAAVFTALGLTELARFPWLGPDTIFIAMMIAIVWAEVGFYLVLLLAGMDKIPPDFYESAKLDGASDFQQFRHITVPLLSDVISIGMVLWAIHALKIFEFPFSFTGLEPNPSSYTVAVYLYILGFGQRQPIYRLGYATAVGVMLLLAVILIVLLLRRVTRREVYQY